MDITALVLFFIFGTIIGSFLNVVALRFNTGATLGGRSKCMSCGHQLTWKELIPVLSFLWQGGLCRNCRSRISRQYVLVELSTGLLFALILQDVVGASGPEFLATIIALISACLFVLISAYDIKHKIIPDHFMYPLAGIAFLNLFLGGTAWFHGASLSQILAGPILALPFALIWLISKGTWMGLGDAKLTLAIGWFLGLGGGANALILAFWIAAIVSVAWLMVTYGHLKPRTEVPFGPYIIIGMYIVMFFRVQAIDFSFLKEVILSSF